MVIEQSVPHGYVMLFVEDQLRKFSHYRLIMTDEFDEIEVYHEKSLESENFKVMTYYNQILKNKEYVSFS